MNKNSFSVTNMQNFHDLAMFRFNFWPKPFLSPPAAHQPFPAGMDSSSFIPNPLGSPALMVLASTAENHEGARVPGTSRYSGQEKETAQMSNANYTMYRPGEHFPPPIYAPVHPFVRPSSERTTHSGVRIMNPAGSSAFRPVADNAELYHSAFSPAKRPKPEDLTQKLSHNTSTDTDEHPNDSDCKDLSLRDDRPSSLSSVNYDTNSETHSDVGDPDRGTPDSEGRSLRKQRKKIILDGQTPYCPICGLTLRTGEVGLHIQQELEKIDRLSIRHVRKSRENTPQGRKTLPSPSGRRGKDSPGQDAVSQARYENYLRVQCNRQARLGARSRNRKKKQEETTCPVCNIRVTGTPEELNEHVELCLKKRDEEEEPVDIEGEGPEQYEEYTWAGQTRIRASTMLDGGYAGSGFAVASSSKHGVEEDCDLNVDDDDSAQYGKPQFSEVDVIPCEMDEPEETRANQALRNAVLSSAESPKLPNHTHTEIEGACNPEAGTSGQLKVEPPGEGEGQDVVGGSAGQIITALKFKLKDKETVKNLYKCLICMEAYTLPVISIQCWHVHCEECWLRTLGAKKLCPQCNMITSPADLRRIYL